MRSIDFTDFVKLPLKEIMDGECLTVELGDQMQFIVVIQPEGGMVPRVNGICTMIESSRGVTDRLAPGATPQEELDANLVGGRVADPDPVELAVAQERVQARVNEKAAKAAERLTRAEAAVDAKERAETEAAEKAEEKRASSVRTGAPA
jgi:hypothetical protein